MAINFKMKKYFHKVFNVHIKIGKLMRSVPLGKGNVEFSEFFLFLQKSNIQDFCTSNIYSQRKLALENTKNYKFVESFMKKKNNYVLVCGGSYGLGSEIVKYFENKNINIIVFARNKKLDKFVKKFKSKSYWTKM